MRHCSTLLLLTIGFVATGGAVPHSRELDATYRFDQYILDFEKTYSNEEYSLRQNIFERNLYLILRHNAAHFDKTKTVRPTYRMGVNRFTDMEATELYYGYDKSSHSAWVTLVDDDGDIPTAALRKLYHGKHQMLLPFHITNVSTLPKQVDWRTKNVTTPVKNQASCGSCWAFASTAVLESHIALQTGTLFTLSPQEMISCIPNPQECGGKGGCLGATAELAYDYVTENGILTEESLPYISGHGEKCECPLVKEDELSPTSILRGAGTSFKMESAKTRVVASIQGFSVLPSNDYTALMNAVAKYGPVSISAAASKWFLYEGGIFSVNDTDESDPVAWDINHAVVAEGYGTDHETGLDYWLVRNSWSSGWGEDGYIRIKRVDPSTVNDPDSLCGIDTTPLDGSACAEDTDGPSPKAVKVCGVTGILFESVVPVGGRKVPL